MGKALGTLIYLLGSIASFPDKPTDPPKPEEKSTLESLAGYFRGDSIIGAFLKSADAWMKQHNIEEDAIKTLAGSVVDGAKAAAGALGLIKQTEEPIYRFINKYGGKEIGWIYNLTTNNEAGVFTADPYDGDHDYKLSDAGNGFFYFYNTSQRKYISQRGNSFYLNNNKTRIRIEASDKGARFVRLKLENGRCIRVRNASTSNKERLQEANCDDNDPSTYWQVTRVSGQTLKALAKIDIIE